MHHKSAVRSNEPYSAAERAGGVDQARQPVHAGLDQQGDHRSRVDIGNTARSPSVRAFEAQGAAATTTKASNPATTTTTAPATTTTTATTATTTTTTTE